MAPRSRATCASRETARRSATAPPPWRCTSSGGNSVPRRRPPEDGDPATGRHGRPGSPRARLFVALDLPTAARLELALLGDQAMDGRDDLRPVPAEALHVTLVFLGYRPEREIR